MTGRIHRKVEVKCQYPGCEEIFMAGNTLAIHCPKHKAIAKAERERKARSEKLSTGEWKRCVRCSTLRPIDEFKFGPNLERNYCSKCNGISEADLRHIQATRRKRKREAMSKLRERLRSEAEEHQRSGYAICAPGDFWNMDWRVTWRRLVLLDLLCSSLFGSSSERYRSARNSPGSVSSRNWTTSTTATI